MQLVPEFIVWFLVFIFSTTCHEAAHAFVAMRGGDATAYSQGHVTLDPLPHMRREPLGMVIMPILSFAMSGGNSLIGWASVPFDAAWGARHPKRWALMSLAGPATNFLLVGVAIVALRGLSAAGVFTLGDTGGTMVQFVTLPEGQDFNSPLGALALFLSVLLQLNVILGIFNLMPIPPLDGSAVVQGLGPPSVSSLYGRVRQNPMLQLLGLVIAWRLFPFLYYPVLRVVLRVLYA